MTRLYYFTLLLCVACTASKRTGSFESASSSIVINGKLFSSVYQQKAAEYKALCFQAYNIARLRLDQYTTPSAKPRAIITDIDETVLDNSDYAVHQALQGKDYEPESWYEWTSRAAADTVPGAPGFLNYAASKGITVFYITNRDERERAGTLQNLAKYHLPNADNEHLILRQTISSKEERRQKVLNDYDVILFIGDNLADFSALFDKKAFVEREQNTRITAAQFGNRFIVLPNPVYGDWEGALFNYNRYTTAQKDSALKVSARHY